MNKMKDLTGQRFGHLTVIRLKEKRYKGKIINGKHTVSYYMWECRCDCGNIVIRQSSDLLSNKNLPHNCGCISRPYKLQKLNEYWQAHPGERSLNSTKHGHANSPTYKCWMSMKKKCCNKNDSVYRFYGGVGITVCKEWCNSFETFLKDMGERPSGKFLCRIDTQKDYYKENCFWGDRNEQLYNRKNILHFFFNGEDFTIKSFCERFNIPYDLSAKQNIRRWILCGHDLSKYIKKHAI